MKTTDINDRKEYKVFVVDDNPLFLKGIVRNLKEKLHCRVEGFPSAEDCLKKIGDKPALIVSDFFLDSGSREHMNGDRFLKELNHLHSHVPVVIYSGRHNMDLAIRALKLGARDFVAKDDHGFEKITQTSHQILNFIKRKYNEKTERKNLIAVSVLVGILIVTAFVISQFRPDFLPVFFIAALGGGILFSLFNIFSSDIRRAIHFSNNKPQGL